MIISLTEFRVAGVFYECEIEELEQLKIDLLHPDCGAVLELEPENEHDAKAIAVYCGDFRIGYVPKTVNEVIFNMMNGKLNVFCEILNVEAQAQKVYARLYLNTDMLLTLGEH